MIVVTIFSWALALIPLGLIGWLLQRAYSKEKALERRLVECDNSLLYEQGYIIERVTLGPHGSQILENAQVVFQPVYQPVYQPQQWMPPQQQ
jgi:hypothetical protein